MTVVTPKADFPYSFPRDDYTVMFTILDTVADNDLATARFACDLSACKGACCTTPGGRGAPLEEAEVAMVVEAIPAALPYLPEHNQKIIKSLGAVEGRKGDHATRCIDNRDCVFVYYDGDVAKCAIERAHFNGESEFRKPLSCHLFPIRVQELIGSNYLRYEKIDECEGARINGRKQGIKLYRFLKDALVRAFGEEFYEALVDSIEQPSQD